MISAKQLYDTLHYYFHNKYKNEELDTCQSNLKTAMQKCTNYFSRS